MWLCIIHSKILYLTKPSYIMFKFRACFYRPGGNWSPQRFIKPTRVMNTVFLWWLLLIAFYYWDWVMLEQFEIDYNKSPKATLLFLFLLIELLILKEKKTEAMVENFTSWLICVSIPKHYSALTLTNIISNSPLLSHYNLGGSWKILRYAIRQEKVALRHFI